MLVGKIVPTHDSTTFRKGDEKGYFEFGGSSIVLLLKKDAIQIDSDILDCSAKGIETKVNLGERIGEKRA
jgi:phosphatidylserine decarboxylase